MNASRNLLIHQRTPLISFMGKRKIPLNIDHSPRPHPAAPSQSLPSSFAEYRRNAQQHGPLASYNTIGSENSSDANVVFDRNQLPKRFWRMTFSKEEMEIIESGGAAAFS
jgi:small subunit ribosomal protein YMR-31